MYLLNNYFLSVALMVCVKVVQEFSQLVVVGILVLGHLG